MDCGIDYFIFRNRKKFFSTKNKRFSTVITINKWFISLQKVASALLDYSFFLYILFFSYFYYSTYFVIEIPNLSKTINYYFLEIIFKDQSIKRSLQKIRENSFSSKCPKTDTGYPHHTSNRGPTG